ncbi:MAG: hypothetical protein AB1477_06285 [Acidobacteriota bacterium]|jgi:hypothetical protein
MADQESPSADLELNRKAIEATRAKLEAEGYFGSGNAFEFGEEGFEEESWAWFQLKAGVSFDEVLRMAIARDLAKAGQNGR